jgi:hypothetical protein
MRGGGGSPLVLWILAAGVTANAPAYKVHQILLIFFNLFLRLSLLPYIFALVLLYTVYIY